MKTLTATKPKLGFAGAGWIGMSRMESILQHHLAEAAGVCDPDQTVVSRLKQEIPDIRHYPSFEAMLDSDPDGIVIATPSALHARQALAALQKGKAVFCQKPLGRNSVETAEVVEAARTQNVLLAVDFSYRYTHAVQQVKKVVHSGDLGEIYAVNLIFHNAYGPGKSWYYDASLSGGGCLMDLGIHLVDLLFWVLDKPVITDLHSRLFHKGRPLSGGEHPAEDYAAAQLVLNHKTTVQLSCSWNLPAGKDAIIEAGFYGTRGGICFRNVDGSFYNFVAEKYNGTTTQILAAPPDDWSGRAAVQWAEALTEGNCFDPSVETCIEVAGVLDALYQNGNENVLSD